MPCTDNGGMVNLASRPDTVRLDGITDATAYYTRYQQINH
jgi:hypothetical protein